MVVSCRLGREGHQEREPEELQPKGIGRECCGRSGTVWWAAAVLGWEYGPQAKRVILDAH